MAAILDCKYFKFFGHPLNKFLDPLLLRIINNYVTVHKPVLPLKSLHELAESTEYLPLVQLDSVAYTLFKVNL